MLRLTVFFLILAFVGPFASYGSEAEDWLHRAQNAFEQGRLSEAQEAAQRARNANPRMADAYVLLGLIASRSNRFSEAEPLFRKAAMLEPANYRTLSYIGTTCLQEGRADEAVQIFATVLRMDPTNAAAHFNLGLIGLSKGKVSNARAHFEKVLSSNPSDVPARFGVLESDLILKDKPSAKRLAQELDRLLPEDAPERLRVAVLLGSYQEYAEVIPILEKLPTKSNGYEEISYDLALAYFHIGAYETASAKLQPALQGPQSAEAYSLLGDIEAAQGRFSEAVAAFRKSTEKGPPNDSVWFAYGAALLQHDEAAQAASVFTSGLTRLPESARLRLGLGAALCAAGRYESGADTLLQLVASHPHLGLSYYLLGEIYEAAPAMQGKIAAVLAGYIKSKPPDSLAYFEYGKILYLRAQATGNSDYQAAESNLRIALGLDPKLGEAYVQLAAIAQDEGRMSDSIALLQKALVLKPALSGAHYKLSRALKKLGRDDQAKAEMDLYAQQKSNEQLAQKQEVSRSLALEGRARP